MPRRHPRRSGDLALLLSRAKAAERDLAKAVRRIAALEAKLGDRVDDVTIFEADRQGYRRGYAAGLRARARKSADA